MPKKLPYLIILSILIAALTAYFYIEYKMNTPLDKKSQEQKIVEIPKGFGVKEIGWLLEKENIISENFYFEIYVWQKRIEKNLQAGEYILSPSMSIAQIAEFIAKGQALSNEIKITIPEGWSARKIDDKLAEAELVKKGEFMNYKIDTDNYEFLKDNSLITYHLSLITNLEGFLFPDTYLFDKDAAIEEIAAKMLDNFDKKLTADLRNEIKNQDKTIFGIITLASIVQNESASLDEMKTIAGVFYNRLKKNYPLESDATINYITGKSLRQPTIEDTKVKSLYNTYLHIGLPPGPISNPGIEAIEAAIYPEKTDYFFFLHPLDGPTVFSKTLQEHNAAKAKYLK